MCSSIFSAFSYSLTSNQIGTWTSQAQSQTANCPRNCHRCNNISLSRIVCLTVGLQFCFNDSSLFSSIMYSRRRKPQPDQRYSSSQWRKQHRGSCRSSSTRYLAGIIFPFSMELFRGEIFALRLVCIKIERHVGRNESRPNSTI